MGEPAEGGGAVGHQERAEDDQAACAVSVPVARPFAVAFRVC
ncbi:hypothetical protein ACFWP7_21405 [Streptomyces sp. NPDC058470]